MQENIIKTDVLVIGSAGAGLSAAIEARRTGADTLMVSKIPANGATCTLVMAGWITCATTENEDQLFKQIVYTGGYINDQRLVDVFVHDAIYTIPQLKDFGVIMEERPGESPDMPAHFMLEKLGNNPKGHTLISLMRKKAEEIGVDIIDDVIITKLIKSNGTVTGAFGINLVSGKLLTISAKSVVIASGGGASAFERSDNPPGTTGDGFILAYLAGAELTNIEFVSLNMPKNIIPQIFEVKCEPPESIISHGTAHYFLGGIKINENCETNIKGLFACGEVTGGLLGSARLGGSAVADAIVFGKRAGYSSAIWAKNNEAIDLDMDQVQEAKDEYIKMIEGNAVSPIETLTKIRSILWRYIGPVKSEYTLNKALEMLDNIKDLSFQAKRSQEILSAYEARNILLLGKILASASLVRKETRGNFWRADYPDPDNEKWIKNIVLWNESGTLSMRIDDVVMTKLHFPVQPPIGAGCFWYFPKIDIK